jgi:TolA-binding protein
MIRFVLTVLALVSLAAGCSKLAGNPAGGRQAGGGNQQAAGGKDAPAEGAQDPAAPAQPQQPKTRIISSMINALQGIDVDDQKAKKEVTDQLFEGDKKLQEVLGENSQRLIRQANRKPPVPVIDVDVPRAGRAATARPSGNEPAPTTPTDEPAAPQPPTPQPPPPGPR